MKTNSLLPLVESYFRDHLQKTRGSSANTIASYRDAIALFLRYAAQRRGVSIDRLQLSDLDAPTVVAFLQHLETQRHNSTRTRNGRRIALRGFFAHAARMDPTHATQYARILALPPKRCATTLPRHLEAHQMQRLLAQPDRLTQSGRRDFALLLFLYNTGARISEAIGCTLRDLQTRPSQIRLRGKGGKERFCPLWPDTLRALQAILPPQCDDPSTALFRSHRGYPLSRHGAQYIISKHARAASQGEPAFPERISPHMLRHSCACALLQAGVDLTVIRDYLGHASITTTSRYAATNLKLKQDALEAFWAQAGLSPPHHRPWRPSKSLMEFLSSL